MTLQTRRKTLVTGAAGGMGRACVSLFGATDDLVLTDVNAERLMQLAERSAEDGHDVVAHDGDLSDEALIDKLTTDLTAGDGPFCVVHTAGLSPSLADWKAIVQVNLLATVKLLDRLEADLRPGSVAILVASSAGHMIPADPQIDGLLANPLQPAFLESVEQTIRAMGGEQSPGGMGGISYMLSKRAVLSLVRQRAMAWGPRGCRIVSISPGMIATAMGKSEMDHTPGARALLDATPIGRVGKATDIALAARFLASEEAGFITGTDLLVDGGGTFGVKSAMGANAG